MLIVSDLHVGSKVALMPEEAVTYAKGTQRETTAWASPMQKEILRRWEAMCDDGPYDLCIVNGDICEGVNRKGRGEGVWAPEVGVQVQTAIDLLKMTKARHFVGTQGSIYHTDTNPSTDAAVIRSLVGEGAFPQAFDDDLIVTVDGIRMHCMHKVGVSSSGWQYRSTPIAKEMMLAVLNSPEFGNFHIIVRSHAHYLVYVGFAHTLGLITPCWKGRDEFVKRLSLAFNPHIGYVTIDVNQGEFDWTRNVWQLDAKHTTTEVKFEEWVMSAPAGAVPIVGPVAPGKKKKQQKTRKKGGGR